VTVRMGEGVRRQLSPSIRCAPSAPRRRCRPWSRRRTTLPRSPAGWPEVTLLDAIDVRGVTRGFHIKGTRLIALEGLDLRVPERQIVSVVGPNGSGKSTLLRVISGLLAPDAGSVTVGGSPVRGMDPRVGLVFQEPRLLPWRSVLSNVALPLELAGALRPAREERARQALVLVGLAGFDEALPGQLSGGMAQRAGLARALVMRPSVLLLDEPFSALDALTRDRLDGELVQLWQRTGTTIVLVTHSIPEAVFVSDRVLVMSSRPGRIVADIPVDVARPRGAEGSEAAAFSQAALRVRAALGAADAGDRAA
jgi:NitT/TauT family transport system ATP-binding protein